MCENSPVVKDNPITQGVIWKQLLIFFFPILLGSFFQQFYSVVDALIVGRFVGKNALAAIDATWSLFRLPTNFFVGLSTGATILISQAFGAKNHQRASVIIHTAVAAAIMFGLIFSVAGVLAAPQCLALLNIPEDIYADSLTYTRIYFSGMFFSLTFNIACGILRALGNSRYPFYFLVVSSLTNIFLDLLFVVGLDWGICGAVVATVIAQALSAALSLYTLTHTSALYRVSLSRIRLHKDTLRNILSIGLPIGLQSIMYPVANILIQTRINTFGTDAIAAWAVCGKLDFVLWLLIDAFAMAISTFVAQNYGANKLERVRQSVKVCVRMSLCMIIPLSAVLFFGTGVLGKFFVQDDTVVALSRDIMYFIAPWYFSSIWGEILSSAIRAMGETVKPMLLTLISTCVLRIAWILMIPLFSSSLFAVLAVFPMSWVVCSLCFMLYYFCFHFNKIKPPK